MPRKHGAKGGNKKKQTLSLFEFNQNVGVGTDPQLSSLPSAPKAAEDWEAQGGRPEYNARGYKEHSSASGFNARSRFDSSRNPEGEDHDWTRRGPLEEQSSGGFGMGGGGERDWSEVRRGPIDTSEDAAPQRDWGDLRRGPVEASFESSRTGQVDWSARRGPIEAERPSGRIIDDNAWGSARGSNTVEASFPNSASVGATEPDWSVRKPIEADNPNVVEEKDWSAPRRGPIASEFEKKQQRTWERRGPIEAEPVTKTISDADWGAPRKGPIEAELPEKEEKKDVDWSARKGPIQSHVERSGKVQKEVDFNDMRRGARIHELNNRRHNNSDTVNNKHTERSASMEKGNWRRERPISVETPRNEHRHHNRPASIGHDESEERDWGAARQSEPIQSSPRPMSPENETEDGSAEKVENTPEQESTIDNGDDDWTTVRSINRRSGAANRRGDNSNSGRRGGGRQGSGRRREFTRPRGQIINKKTTTSPVTPPVTSTES